MLIDKHSSFFLVYVCKIMQMLLGKEKILAFLATV
jgi:hypothetical protein